MFYRLKMIFFCEKNLMSLQLRIQINSKFGIRWILHQKVSRPLTKLIPNNSSLVFKNKVKKYKIIVCTYMYTY